MNTRRDQEPGSSDQQQQHVQQQNPSSGEGSGSAMDAMLRKRRQGENHIELDDGDPPGHAFDDAMQSK